MIWTEDPEIMADLIERYQACAMRIWELFPHDPLLESDLAHTWIERLESVLSRELLRPVPLAELERAVVEAAAKMCAVGMIDLWDSDNAPLYDNLANAVDALIQFRNSNNPQSSSESDVPHDPEMQPFDMTMAGGFVVSFSMKTNLKIGDQIKFWGKSYIVWNREEKDGFIRYSLAPDSIPEVKYLGSTTDGEQFKIGPPTRTMIEDSGPPSTFVQDRLAEMIEPGEIQIGTNVWIESRPTADHEQVHFICRSCGGGVWCQILNRVNTPIKCFRCEAITYVMRNDSDLNAGVQPK